MRPRRAEASMVRGENRYGLLDGLDVFDFLADIVCRFSGRQIKWIVVEAIHERLDVISIV